ncbi:InlB B-repeat-containing protein, partial [Bifidobacterium platyrrhinorum]
QTLLQTVTYKAGTQTFATYAAGIQAPAVEGKVFAGWAFASNEGDKLVDATETVNGDWSVYATYKDVPAAKDATVSFYGADQTLLQTVTYKAGTQTFATYAAGIQAPSVEGKVFAGWAFASNEGDKLVDTTETVNGDWSVYATYKDAPKTDDTKENVVSFYDKDQNLIQTVGYYAKDQVKFSQYAASIQAPSVKGKVFTGWAFASNDGDVAVDPDAVVTGDWAVYATYKDAPKTDDDTQNVVSFYDADQNLIQTVGYKAGTQTFATYALGIQAPSVEGKVFAGWAFASNEGDVLVNVDDVVTGDWAVYATYKDAPKTDDTKENVVSFYDADQNLIQTVGYYAKDQVKFSQYALGIQAPAVEGKVFVGWGFASNDGDVAVNVDDVVTGDWAVYAMYKDAPKTDDTKENVVSFYDKDQNLIQTVGYYAKDKVKFSQYALGIQAPAVEGKVFAGWAFASNEGDKLVDVTETVTGDWAVYATYKDAPKTDDTKENVVSFYDADQNLIQTVGYYAKDQVKFSQYALGIQAPAVEGKVFVGWGFASNDGDVAVNVDDVVTGDWAVYAMYKDAPKTDDDTQNVVSFYDADQNLIQTVGYYAKDQVKFSQYALGIQAPAVEGKVFVGWGFASNDGDVAVDPDAVVTGNWAVYAMYKDAPKTDNTKGDQAKKTATKAKAKKKAGAILGETGSAVAGVAVFAVIAIAGAAAVTLLRKRA